MNVYLALGDSITAGYGVGRAFSYPSLYAAFLRRHYSDLHLRNFGVNGMTTGGLRDLLQTDQSLRHLVAQASLITLTIGSNDLLHLLTSPHRSMDPSQFMGAINAMDKNLTQVGGILRRLNPTATIKIATLYNPLPAGPYAQYYQQAQGVLNYANASIIAWGKRYGAEVVDLNREFRGKERLMIGRDSVHPSAAGYQVIAKAFARY